MPERQAGGTAGARRRLRSRPRTLILVLAAAAVVVTAVVAAVDVLGSEATADTDRDATATAPAARRDLVQHTTVSGTLGYDDARRVVNYRQGTITALPPEGRVLQPGSVLYRVNEQPVVLLSGSRPAWRPLAVGVTDGRDVLQLEQNLRALRYDRRQEMRVDGRFDAATAAAVQRWQVDVGLAATGRVAFGDVVFLPGARRVGTVAVSVGDPARRAAVMATSSNERLVTAEIDASDQEDIAVGDKVLIDLLNGTTTTGTVTEVGKVASAAATETGGGQAGGSTISTIMFEVRPNKPAVAGRLDQAPVEVGVTSKRARNVLSVPVTALLALRGGRYGVEVVRDGTRTLVPVNPGIYSDGGYVELRGGQIEPGDRVVVPR